MAESSSQSAIVTSPGFVASFNAAIAKGVTFSGRARRSEYWYWKLFTVIGAAIAGAVDAILGSQSSQGIGVLAGSFIVVIILPDIAVTVRRLHDSGRSGWWWWLHLVPVVGWLIIVILMCAEGTRGDNRFGHDPLTEKPRPPAAHTDDVLTRFVARHLSGSPHAHAAPRSLVLLVNIGVPLAIVVVLVLTTGQDPVIDTSKLFGKHAIERAAVATPKAAAPMTSSPAVGAAPAAETPPKTSE